jgi:hypothetical protein
MKSSPTFYLLCSAAALTTLSSCETLENPAFNLIMEEFASRSGNNAVIGVWQLVKGIHASQRQIKAAQDRASDATEKAKEKKVRYAAVKVPKEDGGKGDRVMIIDANTGKPKDEKTYAIKDGASKGESKHIGGVEATVVDNIQAL